MGDYDAVPVETILNARVPVKVWTDRIARFSIHNLFLPGYTGSRAK